MPPSSGINLISSIASAALDVTAFVTLPDNATWFLPGGSNLYPAIDWTSYNVLLLDDVAGEQFAWGLGNQTSAPSPSTITGNGVRVTQYSRGLVPEPDPKNGLPIVAILGVGGGSPPNPLNQITSAQVFVQERARYVLN